MEKHLHIITHEIPWPAAYGGVMDIYHKIKALHRRGVKIHLHCFTRRNRECGDLEKYCHSIDCYRRKRWPSLFHAGLPYIVSSRISDRLEKNLSADAYPVLAEGIHCSYLSLKRNFAGRKFFLRLHNAEWRYYASLAAIEKNLFRKAYYHIESALLRRYEKRIARKVPVICVSRLDMALYLEKCSAMDARFLPVFNGFKPSYPGPQGDFCLYHGNLAVNENEKAVRWLLGHVFNTLSIPLVVAGRSPSSSLCRAVRTFPHISLVADPSDEELEKLIRGARVNVLPSFNDTGVKLKIIHSLFTGRHCLVNPQAAAGSGLEESCHMAAAAPDFSRKVKELFSTPFGEEDFRKRRELLEELYDNDRNAGILMQWIC